MREEKRYFNLLLVLPCTLQKSGGIHWPKFIDINRSFPFFFLSLSKSLSGLLKKVNSMVFFLLLWVENKWKSENISSNSCAKKKRFKWSELNLIYLDEIETKTLLQINCSKKRTSHLKWSFYKFSRFQQHLRV